MSKEYGKPTLEKTLGETTCEYMNKLYPTHDGYVVYNTGWDIFRQVGRECPFKTQNIFIKQGQMSRSNQRVKEIQ